MQLHLAVEPAPPRGASPELARVVAIALAKDPRARFPTMRAFAEALRATPELRGPKFDG